jgi:hypothetical protein
LQHCTWKKRGWIRHHQDFDVLVCWRDVGQARFPRKSVMARQFLAIPAVSATAERVSSFAGLKPLRPAQISV